MGNQPQTKITYKEIIIKPQEIICPPLEYRGKSTGGVFWKCICVVFLLKVFKTPKLLNCQKSLQHVSVGSVIMSKHEQTPLFFSTVCLNQYKLTSQKLVHHTLLKLNFLTRTQSFYPLFSMHRYSISHQSLFP